jgi:hypothetical protein
MDMRIDPAGDDDLPDRVDDPRRFPKATRRADRDDFFAGDPISAAAAPAGITAVPPETIRSSISTLPR